jgi:hypothetical protein
MTAPLAPSAMVNAGGAPMGGGPAYSLDNELVVPAQQ